MTFPLSVCLSVCLSYLSLSLIHTHTYTHTHTHVLSHTTVWEGFTEFMSFSLWDDLIIISAQMSWTVFCYSYYVFVGVWSELIIISAQTSWTVFCYNYYVIMCLCVGVLMCLCVYVWRGQGEVRWYGGQGRGGGGGGGGEVVVIHMLAIFFIHMNIILIYVMSLVWPAAWPSFVANTLTLHTNCTTKFVHTCPAYRHHWLLPSYTTFTDLDLP